MSGYERHYKKQKPPYKLLVTSNETKKYTYSYAKQNRTESMRYKVQRCRGGGGGGHVNPTTSTAYLLLKAYLKAFKIRLTNRSILQGALHANTRITQKQQTQIYSRAHTHTYG